MATTKDKKISEKSTKQELWSAYNELVAQTGAEEIVIKEDSSVNDVIKQLSETKININNQFDALTKSLMSDLALLYKTAEQIRQNKEAMIKQFEDQKDNLANTIAAVRTKWNQEEKSLEEEYKAKKDATETAFRREEEEYKYNQLQVRKKEQDEYNEDKRLRQKAIADEEATLSIRKKEIAEMEKQIAEFPSLIEQKVKATEAFITQDLGNKYQSQIKDLSTAKDHAQKIADINISNLDKTIKSQAEEIMSLKAQLVKTNDLLKEMAISALDAKKPIALSNKSNTE